MTPADRDKVIALGRQAKQLADSEFFNSVVNHVITNIVKQMATLPVGDPGVAALHAEMVACNKFKEVLQSITNDGVMAENTARRS